MSHRAEALTAKDLRAVLDVVYAVNEDTGEGEISNRVLARLGELVGCDSLSYSRVEHTTRRLLGTTIEPAALDISGLPAFHATFAQHPGFAAYRTGRLVWGTSVALTDLADLRTLRRLPLYTDFYRPRGMDDQLLCVVQLGHQQGSVLNFNRTGRGFSTRDRTIVDLIAPYLSQAVARRQRLPSTTAMRALVRHNEQVEQARPRLATLSARERQVVDHLLCGATDREIARSLAISPRTVHKHLQHTYRKLDIGNRASLIALAHQASDINPPTGQDTPRYRLPATAAVSTRGRRGAIVRGDL